MRFASEIDYTKNSFISVDETFDYNKELAVWSEHKVYHNCYLKYDKHYHAITKKGEKIFLPTSSKVKVYTFIDRSEHIFYKDEWYDLKSIKNLPIKPSEYIKTNKTQEEINLSKAHKPSRNHPWVKQGLIKLRQG
ncbi:MAG: hypothetical protein HFI09_03345 [Bacilli bacterium]|nr:hypothetical protein [Bacilli bacterium]